MWRFAQPQAEVKNRKFTERMFKKNGAGMVRKPSLVLPVLLVVLHMAAQQAPPLRECAGSLTPAELDRRIDGLIAQMTPEERIAQLQDRAPAIQRLGIPAYNWWNEGLHGIARNGYATVFPQAIGLASTFDPALLKQVGEVVGTEARAKFNPHQAADSARYAGLTIWSPNINIFRDPRWGRGQETYGEDPYLTALLAGGFVHGIQGPEGYYRRADATLKHFAAHSGPESERDGFNARVSEHDLNDTYLAAFYALTGPAHADAMMCSYNAIDGTPACANAGLIEDQVRKQWGFAGYVVSDCDAVDEITEYLHFTHDHAHGAAAALKAGVDLDCGGTYNHLNEALREHLIAEQDVNRALHRLLLARFRLGMLQPVFLFALCGDWSRGGEYARGPCNGAACGRRVDGAVEKRGEFVAAGICGQARGGGGTYRGFTGGDRGQLPRDGAKSEDALRGVPGWAAFQRKRDLRTRIGSG